MFPLVFILFVSFQYIFEFANLRAFLNYVPYWPTSFMCLRASKLFVLTAFVSQYLELSAYVPSFFTYLCALIT